MEVCCCGCWLGAGGLPNSDDMVFQRGGLWKMGLNFADVRVTNGEQLLTRVTCPSQREDEDGSVLTDRRSQTRRTTRRKTKTNATRTRVVAETKLLADACLPPVWAR